MKLIHHHRTIVFSSCCYFFTIPWFNCFPLLGSPCFTSTFFCRLLDFFFLCLLFNIIIIVVVEPVVFAHQQDLHFQFILYDSSFYSFRTFPPRSSPSHPTHNLVGRSFNVISQCGWGYLSAHNDVLSALTFMQIVKIYPAAELTPFHLLWPTTSRPAGPTVATAALS